jgi:hypothetical protein
MVRSAQYPEERQARRVFELSYPEVDEAVRENYAYLVAARRLTLDDAMEKLQSEVESGTADCKPKSLPTVSARPPPARPPMSTRCLGSPIASSSNNGGSAAPATSLTQRSTNCASRGTEAKAGANNVPPRSESPGGSDDSAEVVVGYRGGNTRISASTRTPVGAIRKDNVPVKESTTFKTAADENASTPSRGVGSPFSATPPTESRKDHSSAYRQGTYDRTRGDRCSSAHAVDAPKPNKDGPNSAPDVLTSNPHTGGEDESDPPAASSGSHPERTAAFARARGTDSRRKTQNDGAADDVLATSKKSAWTEPAEKKPSPSCGGSDGASMRGTRKETAAAAAAAQGEEGREKEGGGCNDADGEPMFSATKLVTDDEKAAFDAKMKEMMHYWYRDETSMYDYTLRSLPRGQVIFFTTSMTGNRQVRDHCRQLENLLHMKLIPHHTIDVADSEFFQRRVRKMYTHATLKRVVPEMPLLFVDDKLIGDFTAVQDLEDAGQLDEKLLEAGCSVLRPRVVAELEAKRMGIPGAPLVLSTKLERKSSNVGISNATAAAPPEISRSAIRKEEDEESEHAPDMSSKRPMEDKATGDERSHHSLAPSVARSTRSTALNDAGRNSTHTTDVEKHSAPVTLPRLPSAAVSRNKELRDADLGNTHSRQPNSRRFSASSRSFAAAAVSHVALC